MGKDKMPIDFEPSYNGKKQVLLKTVDRSKTQTKMIDNIDFIGKEVISLDKNNKEIMEQRYIGDKLYSETIFTDSNGSYMSMVDENKNGKFDTAHLVETHNGNNYSYSIVSEYFDENENGSFEKVSISRNIDKDPNNIVKTIITDNSYYTIYNKSVDKNGANFDKRAQKEAVNGTIYNDEYNSKTGKYEESFLTTIRKKINSLANALFN